MRRTPRAWRRPARETRRRERNTASSRGMSIRGFRHPETDIALALDLVDQLDFPFQVAFARALAGVGVVGPPPAIVGRVGHRLAPGRERQSGFAPRLGAAPKNIHGR